PRRAFQGSGADRRQSEAVSAFAPVPARSPTKSVDRTFGVAATVRGAGAAAGGVRQALPQPPANRRHSLETAINGFGGTKAAPIVFRSWTRPARHTRILRLALRHPPRRS